MKFDLKKTLTSPRAKKIYLVFALFLLLFFVCNDLILPWYVNQGGELVVPSVIGLKLENAKQTLDSLGLEAREGDTRTDREHPPGTVIIQNPMSGSKVKKGRRVYLTISEGEQMVSVPNIKGRTLRDARFVLEREGLRLGAVQYQQSEEFPPNTIMEQKVGVGAKVKRNVYVSVVVSQGRSDQQVAVPDLHGKNLAEAGKILANSGLKVGNISYVPSAELLPNTIVDQFPRPAEMVQFGQAVDLFVVRSGEKKKDIWEN